MNNIICILFIGFVIWAIVFTIIVCIGASKIEITNDDLEFIKRIREYKGN